MLLHELQHSAGSLLLDTCPFIVSFLTSPEACHIVQDVILPAPEPRIIQSFSSAHFLTFLAPLRTRSMMMYVASDCTWKPQRMYFPPTSLLSVGINSGQSEIVLDSDIAVSLRYLSFQIVRVQSFAPSFQISVAGQYSVVIIALRLPPGIGLALASPKLNISCRHQVIHQYGLMSALSFIFFQWLWPHTLFPLSSNGFLLKSPGGRHDSGTTCIIRLSNLLKVCSSYGIMIMMEKME
ncbi:hypothetical protein Tco_0631309 [Tanacetum coccineum]